MAYKDPERAREYQREWRRQWRAKNPEKVREANRKSHEKHHDERIASMLEYRQGRREELAQKQSVRRAAEGPRVARDRNLRNLYGISLADYEDMVAAQDGKCAICDKEPEKRVLEVDHCHQTGRIRGLLCRNCNLAIGKLYDSAEVMERALAYLRR